MSIATVQQQLAASRLGEVELRACSTQLCESLGASMIRSPDLVSLKVSGDDSKVNADVSVSRGLIVTELVINALKHAFPGERGGTIRVDYHALGETWKLTVHDDGVGTPRKLETAKPGLGTSIVEALAKQLHATVETAGASPGTRVFIVHEAPVSVS